LIKVSNGEDELHWLFILLNAVCGGAIRTWNLYQHVSCTCPKWFWSTV